MPESLALLVATEGGVPTAVDLLAGAVALEMTGHAYFTGPAVRWLAADGAGGAAPPADQGPAVLRRLRELRREGALHVYACSQALAAQGLSPQSLSYVVDSTAGFAFFLSLATEATLTMTL